MPAASQRSKGMHPTAELSLPPPSRPLRERIQSVFIAARRHRSGTRAEYALSTAPCSHRYRHRHPQPRLRSVASPSATAQVQCHAACAPMCCRLREIAAASHSQQDLVCVWCQCGQVLACLSPITKQRRPAGATIRVLAVVLLLHDRRDRVRRVAEQRHKRTWRQTLSDDLQRSVIGIGFASDPLFHIDGADVLPEPMATWDESEATGVASGIPARVAESANQGLAQLRALVVLLVTAWRTLVLVRVRVPVLAGESSLAVENQASISGCAHTNCRNSECSTACDSGKPPHPNAMPGTSLCR
jgi:hypothetical protein